ncbi:MAG TPA: hypothetical protein VIL99_09595 [Ignavibacteria bacterium]
MEDNTNKFEFQIKGIFVTNFNLNLCDEFIKADQKTERGFNNYTFEVTCINNVAVPDNILNIEVVIKIFLDVEKKVILGSLKIGNVFSINNLKTYYDEKNNVLNLPPDIEASLIGISLSHARAILLAKCAGTFLQNAVLPILDPKAFIKKLNK